MRTKGLQKCGNINDYYLTLLKQNNKITINDKRENIPKYGLLR